MHSGLNLAVAASWATPRAEDGQSEGLRHSRGVADTLTAQASWATPSSRDHKDSSDPATWVCTEDRERMDQLPRQVFGVMPSGSPAATGKQDPPDAGFTPSSWATPRTKDSQDWVTNQARLAAGKPDDTLCGQAKYSAEPMLKAKGQLNPALSRFLMGLPEAWCEAAIAAHRLIRTKRARRG